ncbi:MAG: hypothetical protein GXO76_13205 [Calditrichaeota bacterium]|nr:hypothetical protein [Calditrichota bacterium]
MKRLLFVFLIFGIIAAQAQGQSLWYKQYQLGRRALASGRYQKAAGHFLIAIRGHGKDSKRVRTYGMHFEEYFPHRELGVAYYYLKKYKLARQQLRTSIGQAPSLRATKYLDLVNRALGGEKTSPQVAQTRKPASQPSSAAKKKGEQLIVGNKTIKLVGERMGIAVLPFENKGASKDLGEIVLDKMTTVLVNKNRFKVMERAQLNRILEEQKLGMSGILDAATAAKIGKGIGVDAIVMGSVVLTQNGSVSIDARVIDTESARIITARDGYSGSSDMQSVKNTVENVANAIVEDLPLVDGFVIQVNGQKIMLDKGLNSGLRPGMKCIIYREGKEIRHPITGEVLGRETNIIGEVLVNDSFEKYSVAKPISTTGGVISVGDKFLTK